MLHKEHKPTVLENGITGYERTDVSGKPLFWNFAVLTVSTIACIVTALWVFRQGEAAESTHSVRVLPVAEERNLPPLPRLQEHPVLDLQAFREQEKARIDEYKWVDKVAGIVQIPVDQALEIVAEQGLPHGREAHIPGQGLLPGGPVESAPALPVPIAPEETAAPAL
ncbi:MAG: hypothetical protein SGI88_14385 [Candidatus Hydrogenedentes bacterium]|nr:hypothetical protein [Candidatus Hydrogenedentota bacterium]